MTYGADFRPGMKILPRHDAVTLPPVAEYQAWIATQSPNARTRASISAARLRRAIYLFVTGNSLASAAKMLGLEDSKLRTTVARMPVTLTGERLYRRFHGEEAA